MPPLFLTPFFDPFLLRLQKFDHADFQGEYVAYTPTQVAERAEWDLGGGVFLVQNVDTAKPCKILRNHEHIDVYIYTFGCIK